MSQSPQEGNVTATSTESKAERDYDWLFVKPRCRLVIDALEDMAPPVELDELATAIAAHESQSESVEEATVKEVAISLHHNHLPKIDRLGVISYNPESNRVERYY